MIALRLRTSLLSVRPLKLKHVPELPVRLTAMRPLEINLLSSYKFIIFFPFKSQTDMVDDRLSLLLFCQLSARLQSHQLFFNNFTAANSVSGSVLSKVLKNFGFFFYLI